MNNVAYIALGSNLTLPIQQLQDAIVALELLSIKPVEVSSFYSSQPLGPQDQPDFVNAVAKIVVELEPIALLDQLQKIELDQGRIRKRRWGERTLDLDILLYNNQIINQPRLVVPHYDMLNREFVIVPLFEIVPQLQIPDGSLLSTIHERFTSHTMRIIYPR